MNLKETLSRFGIHFIEKWFRIMVLINCLSPVTAQCVAQSNSANFNRNVSRAISVSSFDSLVSHSIVLLETKELSQISDSEHIKIMMCLNTITFTIIKHSFKKRFTDEKYQRFIRLSEEKGYPWSLVNIYPKWFPNRGMGLYFPQLKMEVYGTPMPYAIFKVRYFEAGPVKLIDSISKNIFVLDTNHVSISAFSKDGPALWKTDLLKDGNIADYRIANPAIVYFELGWTHECSWCKIPGDERVLWIEYDNRQIDFLDLLSGKFH